MGNNDSGDQRDDTPYKEKVEEQNSVDEACDLNCDSIVRFMHFLALRNSSPNSFFSATKCRRFWMLPEVVIFRLLRRFSTGRYLEAHHPPRCSPRVTGGSDLSHITQRNMMMSW